MHQGLEDVPALLSGGGDDLWNAIALGIDTFTPTECQNYFAAAAYDLE